MPLGVAPGGLPGNPGAAPPANSAEAFAIDVLNGAGLPTCHNNLVSMVAWQAAEGYGVNSQNNPLNTTLSDGSTTAINSDGVKKYPDWNTGVHATVKTLNMPAYAGIRNNLRSCSDPRSTVAAVASSPWGTKASDLSVVSQVMADFKQFAQHAIGTSGGHQSGSDLPGQGAVSAVTGAVGGIGSGLASVGSAFGWLLNPGNWIRILYIVAGFAMMVGGLVLAAKNTVLS